MKTHYQIALPVNKVLTTLIAEAKVIGDEVVIKSLVQQMPANWPSIDKIKMLDNPAYEQEVKSQIENLILANKLMKEFYR